MFGNNKQAQPQFSEFYNNSIDFTSTPNGEDWTELYPHTPKPLWWDDASYIRYQTDCGEQADAEADKETWMETTLKGVKGSPIAIVPDEVFGIVKPQPEYTGSTTGSDPWAI